MCITAAIPAPELYDDLAAILDALTGGDGVGASLEKRAAWSAAMIRVILGTSDGAPRSAAELRARLDHPASGTREPAGQIRHRVADLTAA